MQGGAEQCLSFSGIPSKAPKSTYSRVNKKAFSLNVTPNQTSFAKKIQKARGTKEITTPRMTMDQLRFASASNIACRG